MALSKNLPQKARLHKAVNSAIWSVKAEGLSPTRSAARNLQKYAEGRITVSEMKQNAINNAHTLVKKSR